MFILIKYEDEIHPGNGISFHMGFFSEAHAKCEIKTAKSKLKRKEKTEAVSVKEENFMY